MTREERREYDRKHYQKHRARHRAQKLANYYAHREEYRTQKAAYRDANREAINLSARIGLPVPTCRKMLQQERGLPTEVITSNHHAEPPAA